MSHVFISYSHKDKDYAQKLEHALRREGFEVWIDSRIGVGDDWWDNIETAIKDCVVFIVIMTPAAKESTYVKRETLLAESWQKLTLPLLLEGENWSFYIHIQYENVLRGTLPSPSFYNKLPQNIRMKNLEPPKSNLNYLRYDGMYVTANKSGFEWLRYSKNYEVIIVKTNSLDIKLAWELSKTSIAKTKYAPIGTSLWFQYTFQWKGYLISENKIEMWLDNMKGYTGIQVYDFVTL